MENDVVIVDRNGEKSCSVHCRAKYLKKEPVEPRKNSLQPCNRQQRASESKTIASSGIENERTRLETQRRRKSFFCCFLFFCFFWRRRFDCWLLLRVACCVLLRFSWLLSLLLVFVVFTEFYRVFTNLNEFNRDLLAFT